jgi:predicted signal transduction protein with EAL and GGDEF domain
MPGSQVSPGLKTNLFKPGFRCSEGNLRQCQVVAEGVKTADQLAKLEELGCDLAQGFTSPNRSRAKPCWRSWPTATTGSRSRGVLRR